VTETGSAAPPSLASIAKRAEDRLARLLDEEDRRWRAFDADLAAPFDAIRQLVSGGKRLRPAFCHWGYVGAGGDPDDPVIADAGAAFELMHAFALFHDDVMDNAATRRGMPTVHTSHSEQHARSGWAGESRRFGEGVAILVGDLALVFSDQLLTGVGPAAWAVWNELRIELNIGQYLDILGSVRSDRRRSQAERICRYKSGKYTIERPLHLGAVLAAPERQDELFPALSAYGLPLGDAFQMRDDVIGAFGDTALTGKPVGDDLREGKPTPLLARAVERATGPQLDILARVGTPDLDAEEIAAIQQVIVDTGALADLEGHIGALTAAALASLTAAPITAEAKAALAELGEFVSQREV